MIPFLLLLAALTIIWLLITIATDPGKAADLPTHTPSPSEIAFREHLQGRPYKSPPQPDVAPRSPRPTLMTFPDLEARIRRNR